MCDRRQCAGRPSLDSILNCSHQSRPSKLGRNIRPSRFRGSCMSGFRHPLTITKTFQEGLFSNKCKSSCRLLTRSGARAGRRRPSSRLCKSSRSRRVDMTGRPRQGPRRHLPSLRAERRGPEEPTGTESLSSAATGNGHRKPKEASPNLRCCQSGKGLKAAGCKVESWQ